MEVVQVFWYCQTIVWPLFISNLILFCHHIKLCSFFTLQPHLIAKRSLVPDNGNWNIKLRFSTIEYLLGLVRVHSSYIIVATWNSLTFHHHTLRSSSYCTYVRFVSVASLIEILFSRSDGIIYAGFDIHWTATNIASSKTRYFAAHCASLNALFFLDDTNYSNVSLCKASPNQAEWIFVWKYILDLITNRRFLFQSSLLRDISMCFHELIRILNLEKSSSNMNNPLQFSSLAKHVSMVNLHRCYSSKPSFVFYHPFHFVVRIFTPV